MSLVTEQEWAEFKQKFNKTYNDEAEDKMRRDLFAKSKGKVEEHNKKYDAGQVTWRMAINHLSDLTEEEYAVRCGRGGGAPTAT